MAWEIPSADVRRATCESQCVRVCLFTCEDRRVCGKMDSERAAAWLQCASLQVAAVAVVLEAVVVFIERAFW